MSNWWTSSPASAQRAVTSTTDWIGSGELNEDGSSGAIFSTSQSPGFTVGDHAWAGMTTVVSPPAATRLVVFAKRVFFSTYGGVGVVPGV